MRKIQFGCGSNILEGWENHDIDVDIRKPLPFEDNSVDFVFAEHIIEHVTSPEVYRFLRECHRILMPLGVIRIAVPCIDKIMEFYKERYIKWLQEKGWGNGTTWSPAENIILNHGHQSAWTRLLVEMFLQAVDFYGVEECEVGKSSYPELQGIEGHGKEIPPWANKIETAIFEAKRGRRQ